MNKKIILSCSILLFLPVFLFASGRGDVFVTKTYQNEGDLRSGFSVAIDSTAWTTVLAARSSRRNAVIRNTSASILVCLSTYTTAGILCNSSQNGLEMDGGEYYTEYSEQILYGRAIDSSTMTVRLKGFEYYDSGD